MTNNIELRKIAEKYLGQGGAKFRKFCGLPSGAAWCNAYVDYIAYEGGVSALYFNGRKETYCPSSIKWCKSNLAQVPLYMALPMDIIYFDWEKNGVPNHIGFVWDRKDSSSIYTIEGNTDGGKVAKKTRAGKYVQGVFRPHFKGAYTLGPIAVDSYFGFNSIANMQKALSVPVDSILGLGTVRALQRRVGVKDDGVIGPATVRAIQSKLCGFKGKDVDGVVGPATIRGLQTWINKTNGSAPAPAPKPTPTKKAYSGAFPDLTVHSGQKIAYTAKALAYAKGTAKKTYTYGKGKAKAAFTAAINKVYPNRSSWSKQCQAGASCDVGAGTIIRYSGYDKNIPRGLQEQIPHLQRSNRWKKTSLTKTSQMLPGDVGIYIGKTKGAHIWIGVGNKLIAEANHTAKYFEHIDTDNYTNANKKTWGIYRACCPSVIENGDKGTEVKKLQAFLNWAGYNCGSADGEVGPKTVAAIKAFQKGVGIAQDGQFGPGSLEKAKAIKK